MIKPLTFVIAMLGVTTFPVCATTILIEGSTRNGGFESGVASPWGGIGVITDGAFANSGNNYGSASGTRADVYQFLPISTADGQAVTLSFWARIPVSNGFDSLSISLSDTGFSHSASVTPVSQPQLSSTEWRFFSYDLTMPSGWNDTGNSKLSIAFPNSAATRSAYLDDVSFSQVPEPTTLSLVLTASLGMIGTRRRRSAIRNTKEVEQVMRGNRRQRL
jgi:hypothetical protein